jgi:hypothetical protein
MFLEVRDRTECAKEHDMTTNATASGLHSFLFEEGRRLENVKFFPGDERGLTADSMCEAAEVAFRSAFEKGLVDNPPKTGRIKSPI